MDNDKNHNELIDKYLSGEMDSREQADFEAQIKIDPELRQLVDAQAGIRLGLKARKAINTGHIEIKLLVQYQENPSQLDRETRSKIEAHVVKCPSCSEELELCQMQSIPKGGTLFDRIKDFFIEPAFTFRPVYGMAAAAIILIAAIIGIRGGIDGSPQMVHHQIVPGEKGVEDNNSFVIGSKTTIITLHFSPEVTQDCAECRYDFELSDPSGAVAMISKSHKYQKDFAFELVSSYFTTQGYYSFRVYETLADGSRELIGNYPIKIRLSD